MREVLVEYAAFVADRAHGFSPEGELYRGRTIPLPMLESVADLPLDLEREVGPRNVLLAFYPGGWCASSEAMLRALQAFDADFRTLSTAVVAITPELPRHARRTVEAAGAGYIVAVDHTARFARALGLTFKLPVVLRRRLRDAGVRLKDWNGEGSYDLPMPALVLLDEARRVRWVTFGSSPDAINVADALDAARAVHGG